MKLENLQEIIIYILKRIAKNEDTEKVKHEFDLTDKQYNEITDLMKLEGYIKCESIYMDGSLNLDNAVITRKGNNLI